MMRGNKKSRIILETRKHIMNARCKFAEKYPIIKVSLYNGFTDTLIERVSNGEIDIAYLQQRVL